MVEQGDHRWWHVHLIIRLVIVIFTTIPLVDSWFRIVHVYLLLFSRHSFNGFEKYLERKFVFVLLFVHDRYWDYRNWPKSVDVHPSTTQKTTTKAPMQLSAPKMPTTTEKLGKRPIYTNIFANRTYVDYFFSVSIKLDCLKITYLYTLMQIRCTTLLTTYTIVTRKIVGNFMIKCTSNSFLIWNNFLLFFYKKKSFHKFYKSNKIENITFTDTIGTNRQENQY